MGTRRDGKGCTYTPSEILDMYEKYVEHEGNVVAAARASNCAYATLRRLVDKGEPKYGIPPFAERFAKLRETVAKRVDKELVNRVSEKVRMGNYIRKGVGTAVIEQIRDPKARKKFRVSDYKAAVEAERLVEGIPDRLDVRGVVLTVAPTDEDLRVAADALLHAASMRGNGGERPRPVLPGA